MKRKLWTKTKNTVKDDAYLLRKSKLNPRKTSSDLQKDLSAAGLEISASLGRRQLVLGDRKATRPQKKQFWTVDMKKKRLAWAKNTENGLRLTGRRFCFRMKAILWYRESRVSLLEKARVKKLDHLILIRV